ncbi:MAG: alpha/beta fold hydrolase [Geminicoccaceae bacterium]
MFEGFDERRIKTSGAEIFCRIGGEGLPLLLLHGNPQTSAMWHKVAPELAQRFTLICADLRGYGRSSKPRTTADHAPYSKRAMARDMVEVMDTLGFDRFLIGSHDRGARVAHRLSLDHTSRVIKLAVLDIAPTREMFQNADTAFATSYWHWYFMIQPSPFPERLMAADPEFYWLKKCGSGAAGLGPFAPEALAEYLACFKDPAMIHGSCEDYRAAATIDIAHDDADGDRKLEIPVLALWGAHGAIEKHFDCLELWRRRALHVEGHSLPGGHYLAEELPEQVITAFTRFFGSEA